MKNILLYFGSFNPVHRGHIALAEYAIEHKLCDEVVLIITPQNPLKTTEGLAPEMDRFEMGEIACAASRYADRIKPSLVEFLLEKPSYTIQTLRYLQENHGAEMRFSILMGADLINQLDQWKEYELILTNYPIYVYPRPGEQVSKFTDRITYLSDAPQCDISSTRIRDAVSRGEHISEMVDSGVADYIRRKGLWHPTERIHFLTAQITTQPTVCDLVERGKLHFSHADWGKALNDFRAALRIDATHGEAEQFVEMIEEILAFRYKDIYNP